MVFKRHAPATGQQLRILAAIGDQLVALGRCAVGRRANHMRLDVDVIAFQQARQAGCSQRAVGVVNLVKVVDLMRFAPVQPRPFGARTLLHQSVS